MTPLHLVVLAAGSGVRFGGVKQLAAVGPNGEAILDLLIERAAHAGFDAVVVVTSAAIEGQMRAHFAVFPPALPVDLALQAEPRGTADAVLAARASVTGSFVVVNADDLYPGNAFVSVAAHLSNKNEPALVAFRVGRTLIGERPVKRARLEVDGADALVAIRESTVIAGDGGLHDDEWVSMNLWAFPQSMFDELERAMAASKPDADGEILLPDVVGALMERGSTVRVLWCDEPCVGISYAEDVDVVRASLA